MDKIKIVVKNTSRKIIHRRTETIMPLEEKVVELERDSVKFKQLTRCSSLDWEYFSKIDEVGLDNLDKLTSLELKEEAQRLGIKNYSKMLKQELIDTIIDYMENPEKYEEVEEEESEEVEPEEEIEEIENEDAEAEGEVEEEEIEEDEEKPEKDSEE